MALEGAAVVASATFGCGALGVAAYSNVAALLRAEKENSEDAPDCAARVIAAMAKASRQVLETPELVRAAFTDPVDELRKAQEAQIELASPAEISVSGAELQSGYATFNGEVLKVGPSVSRVTPLLALAGAQVVRDGKTLTVLPKQAPPLVLQLEDAEQAAQWQSQLHGAAEKHPDPVARLDHLVSQAHDLVKHLGDIRSHMQRPVRHKAEGPKDKADGPHKEGHKAEGSHAAAAAHDHGPAQVAGAHAEPHHPPATSSASATQMAGAAELAEAETHRASGSASQAEELEEMKLSLTVAECREIALRQQLDMAQGELAASERARMRLKADLDTLRLQEQEASPPSPSRDPELVKLKMKLHKAQEELSVERAALLKQESLVVELQTKLHASDKELQLSKKQEAEPHGRTRGDRRLSNQEVQAVRAHMQSLQRRSVAEGEDYDQQLKEMDEKMKDRSPCRSPVRGQRRVDELAQEVEEKRSEISPLVRKNSGLSFHSSNNHSPNGRSPVVVSRQVATTIMHSPLRRPSPSQASILNPGTMHNTDSVQTLTYEFDQQKQVMGPPLLQGGKAQPPSVLLAPQGGPRWVPWPASDQTGGAYFSQVVVSPPSHPPGSVTLPIGNTQPGMWSPSAKNPTPRDGLQPLSWLPAPSVTPERASSVRLPPQLGLASTVPGRISPGPLLRPAGAGGVRPPYEPVMPI